MHGTTLLEFYRFLIEVKHIKKGRPTIILQDKQKGTTSEVGLETTQLDSALPSTSAPVREKHHTG
jgi:hypothetical protein